MVMTAIAIGLTVASIASQAYQQHKAAKAQAQAATLAGQQAQQASESGARMFDWNASIARLQAADAVERGKEEEARFRQQIGMMIGAQRAGFAAQNVDVGYGSAVDVQADTAYLGELDALQIRTNAAREAWGFEVQATDYAMRAEIARKEGMNAAEMGRVEAAAATSAGHWAVAGTLLGGGASLMSQRYGFGSSSSAGGSAGRVTTPSTRFSAGTASFGSMAPAASGYGSAFRGVSFGR
jgi:hypothetical protein